MKFLALSLLLFFLTTGCTTVARLPATTGQAPVVTGGLLKFRTGLDIRNSIPVTVIQNITTNPPSRSQIGVGEDSEIFSGIFESSLGATALDINMGLLEKIDLFVSPNIGARYMFWGTPRKQGWRATAFASYFSRRNSESSTISTNTYNVSIRTSGYELGASVGKKINDLTLFYLTLASRGGSAEIETSENATLTYKNTDTYDHYLATLGFIRGKEWYFKLEISGNQIDWRGSDTNGLPISDSGFEFGSGLGFGYNW